MNQLVIGEFHVQDEGSSLKHNKKYFSILYLYYTFYIYAFSMCLNFYLKLFWHTNTKLYLGEKNHLIFMFLQKPAYSQFC